MKFTERAKAFLGDLFDGVSCRIATAAKFCRNHPIPTFLISLALLATAVLLCIFVPKIKIKPNSTNTVVIPTAVPTAKPTDTPAPTATPDPTPSPEPLRLARGVENDIVYSVQLRLMELNYMDYDEPTNYYGPITTDAVKLFQRRNHLEVTGEILEPDYSLLMSSEARKYMACKGDEGTDINEISKRLYELDYLKETTDVFNDEMEEAVKLFQQKNSLEPDGMIGTQTRETLYYENAIPNALYIGSKGDEVLDLQERLYKLGYLSTEPDGVYGKDTVNAVKRFQSRNDIIVDGYMGPSTKKLLTSSEAKYNKLELTMSGDDVYQIQLQLRKLNYLTASEVTRYFGSVTEDAVRAFQKNNRLIVDGMVGRDTHDKLFAANAVKSVRPVSSTPEPTKTPRPTNTPKPTPKVTQKPTKTNSPGKPTPKPTVKPVTPKPVTPKPVTPKPTNSNGSNQAKIQNFINIAKSKLGCPYVLGAKGPNAFDCSGFVYWCLNKAGVQQSYMTSYMWRTTTRYPRISSMSNIKAGDVIVYKMGAYEGHVAIAVGGGMMVDASSRNGKVVYRSYNTAYWHNTFYCAYRIFGS